MASQSSYNLRSRTNAQNENIPVFGTNSFSEFTSTAFTFSAGGNQTTSSVQNNRTTHLPFIMDSIGSQPQNKSSSFSFTEPETSRTIPPASKDPVSVGSTFGPPNKSVLTGASTESALHLALVEASDGSEGQDSKHNARLQDIKTAPMFSQEVRNALQSGRALESQLTSTFGAVFPQYGLLGIRERGSVDEDTIDAGVEDQSKANGQDLIYANMDAPWSAFICGSQGAGKSHTLSCLLENALMRSSIAGKLPKPLTGIVFHYDRFTSYANSQLCEAAYLCSAGVPVRVLVSPSNVWAMTRLYTNLPGLPPNSPKPEVMPLYLLENQLNVSNMMALMATADALRTPLYLEILYMILREMAAKKQGAPGLDYNGFKARLNESNFRKDQMGPLQLRLQLLESFLDPTFTNRAGQPMMSDDDIWTFQPGTLTIVDLSCPFVNADDACALFSICLSIFLEQRCQGGRIVALDEAHKFMSQSGDAERFTDDLVSIICQQRHLATRVLLSTQEPTLSPRLLDLCNITIVHRFLSPTWFATMRSHLAGAGKKAGRDENTDLFKTIVGLETGQALVFSPTSLVNIVGKDQIGSLLSVKELGDSYFRIRIRKRLTVDGGKSMMATDKLSVNNSTNLQVPIKVYTPPAKILHTVKPVIGVKREHEVGSQVRSAPLTVAPNPPAMAPSFSENAVKKLKPMMSMHLDVNAISTSLRQSAARALQQFGGQKKNIQFHHIRGGAAASLNISVTDLEARMPKSTINGIIHAELDRLIGSLTLMNR